MVEPFASIFIRSTYTENTKLDILKFTKECAATRGSSSIDYSSFIILPESGKHCSKRIFTFRVTSLNFVSFHQKMDFKNASMLLMRCIHFQFMHHKRFHVACKLFDVASWYYLLVVKNSAFLSIF